jgi:hypothetical protein
MYGVASNDSLMLAATQLSRVAVEQADFVVFYVSATLEIFSRANTRTRAFDPPIDKADDSITDRGHRHGRRHRGKMILGKPFLVRPSSLVSDTAVDSLSIVSSFE